MSDYNASARSYFLERVRKAAFLDAVFLLCLNGNRLSQWYPLPPITNEEALGDYDEEAFAACAKRAENLLKEVTWVGMAALRYAGACSLEEATRDMKERNPGFSDESYGEVVSRGMFAMR